MNKTSTPQSRRPQPGRDKPDAPKDVDPTRDLAFDALVAVLERRRPLDFSLDEAGGAAQETRDRAAAHRLAATVLRRLGTLDALLDPLLTRAPPEKVRLILRIGAAQLLLLDTPAHAAVTTAVALARRRGLTPFAGLVNAVLRRLGREGAEALAGLDTTRLDTPAWLWRAWASLDAGRVRAIAEAQLREAPLDLTLRDGAAIPEGGERLPTGSVRFAQGTRPAALDGFEAGTFWVQDAAAAIPARLLETTPGERVADLCAAPGGKTAQLAATGAHVTAIERDAGRIVRLRENLVRLGFGEVPTIEADALAWRPEAPLDAVLLDAPCSATGTIRRHPDALRIKREQDIAALAETQDRFIEAAAAMLKPGGRLVYSVCSLQPQEGEARIERALASGAWTRVRIDAGRLERLGLGGLAEAITPAGALRTDPARWTEIGGMDGFFIALLIRN